jgi:hypothetical protein
LSFVPGDSRNHGFCFTFLFGTVMISSHVTGVYGGLLSCSALCMTQVIVPN